MRSLAAGTWVALVSAIPLAQTTTPPLASGDYWLQPPSCISYPITAPNMSEEDRRRAGRIRWCVDRMEIRTDRTVVYMHRELPADSPAELEYGSVHI